MAEIVELETGQVVADRYKVVGRLGAGAMGAVHLVEHVQLRKQFALKILRAEGPSLKERFEREARLVALLDHPNIVRVTDFGESPGVGAYMVMEHVDGASLGKTLLEPRPLEAILDIATQILDGLEHAHKHEVIHRDLKPDNVILVEREGRPVAKILDFGLAKLLPEDSGLTMEGMVFGTPRYMAPEQAAGEIVDHRVDLYALAVLLWEMLERRPLFLGTSVQDTLRKQILEPPPPVSSHPALQPVLAKALEKNAAQRYATAGELRDALLGAAGLLRPARMASVPGTLIPAIPTPTQTAVDQTLVPKPRSKAPIFAGLAVALAIAGGAIAHFGRDDTPERIAELDAALRIGDLEKAKALASAAIIARPKDPRIALWSAHVALAAERPQDALAEYERALVADPSLAADARLVENVRKATKKGPSKLVELYAEKGGSEAAPVLVEVAKDAPRTSLRKEAFDGLERLGELDQLGPLEWLLAELERNGRGSCDERKWYVDRLIRLDVPEIVPALKRERDRKVLFFPASDCMQKDIGAALERLAPK